MFSKTCQYAIQGMLYIASNSVDNKPVQIKQFATAQQLPSSFLHKILQSLVKKKLLKSKKGPYGGFHLSRPMDEIYIIHIYEAIDGMGFFENCVIGFDKCSSDRPCPMHRYYEGIKIEVLQKLSSITLGDLYRDVNDGRSYLSFYVQKT